MKRAARFETLAVTSTGSCWGERENQGTIDEGTLVMTALGSGRNASGE